MAPPSVVPVLTKLFDFGIFSVQGQVLMVVEVAAALATREAAEHKGELRGMGRPVVGCLQGL